jgi:hypothetical protein
VSNIPRYLSLAREALEVAPQSSSSRERSERSERSRRFQPGGRYEVKGPLIGIIHRTTPNLDVWRQEHGLPRAGLMTIQGEMVLVADVRSAVRTGIFDVVGVPSEAAS